MANLDQICDYLADKSIIESIQLNTSSLPSGVTTAGNNIAYRTGNIVTAYVNLKTGTSSRTISDFIPVGYRPYENVNPIMSAGDGTNVSFATIRSDGTLVTYAKGAGYVQGDVTYMVNTEN